MITTTIKITKRQREWLNSKDIKLSEMIRRLIDEKIEKEALPRSENEMKFST